MFESLNNKKGIAKDFFWNINSLNILVRILEIIFFVILTCIIYFIYWNNKFINNLFDKWYNYSIFFEYIKTKDSYFLTFIIAYLLFIWYIWTKKWLLNESNTYNSYYQILSYIYKWLSFLLIPFLFYLWINNNYFEIWLLIFITYIFNWLLWFLLFSFWRNFENIKTIIFLNDKANHKTKIYISLKKFFNEYLPYFIWITITLSFLIIPLWFNLKFNIFSILYLHIWLLISFIFLNLMTNKFPWIADIWYNWKVYKKYFIIENTKERIIIKNEEEILVLRSDKIDFIKMKN